MTLLSAVMLNLGQILGSGIFSVPGVVLDSVGSVGLALSFWVVSPIFALGMWYSFANMLSKILIYFLLQSRYFPMQNLLASSPDAPAERSYSSSTLTRAQGSLFQLHSLSLLFFSRMYSL